MLITRFRKVEKGSWLWSKEDLKFLNSTILEQELQKSSKTTRCKKSFNFYSFSYIWNTNLGLININPRFVYLGCYSIRAILTVETPSLVVIRVFEKFSFKISNVWWKLKLVIRFYFLHILVYKSYLILTWFVKRCFSSHLFSKIRGLCSFGLEVNESVF